MGDRLGSRALVGLALASMACSDAANLTTPPMGSAADAGAGGSSRDAGASGGVDAGTALPGGEILSEDFDHLGWIETASVARVDVNHGWATLPASTFPELGVMGVRTLSDPTSYNGLLAAGSIVVLDAASVEASDSIELLASDTVHVSGRIRAGAGGVRIAAGRAIYLDGVVESAGPIKLQLAGEDGELRLGGELTTLGAQGSSAASITVESRGRVRITGALRTSNGSFGAGSISVTAYGEISVEGPRAVLAGGASVGGAGGAVVLRSEARVRLLDGALLAGGDAELGNGARSAVGGGVEISAASIELSGQTRLQSGRALGGAAGALVLRASGVASAGAGAELIGGAGRVGGEVRVDVGSLEGAMIARAGDGDELPGRVRFSAAGPLSLSAGARLVGGSGVCGPGADVVLIAAGELGLTEGVELRGGRAGTGSSCLTEAAGGSVRVIARAVAGDLERAATGGDGRPAGSVTASLDPAYGHAAPETRLTVDGCLVSRPIERPSTTIGGAPTLLSLRAALPQGTSARLELADADREPLAWVPLEPDRPATALSGAARLRYRLKLGGRALDAPIVDGFELHLGR